MLNVMQFKLQSSGLLIEIYFNKFVSIKLACLLLAKASKHFKHFQAEFLYTGEV